MPELRSVYTLALSQHRAGLPYLSLGMILAYLKVWNAGELHQHYHLQDLQIGGIDDYPVGRLVRRIAKDDRPVCLLSSYVWNHKVNLRAARRIKEVNPSAVIVFGGPEVPRFSGETEAFLMEHEFVDIAVLGEGEAGCAELLRELAKPCQDRDLANVPGIVFRNAGEVLRTVSRQRITDINVLPSPYITGEVGEWFYDFDTAILETNRGCPYGCTYCDWGSATLQKVTKFDPARVIADIEYIASRRANRIFIADANFGMLEQDIEIAQALVDVRARTGYPRRLMTNFAKNGGRRLMAVIKILHEGGLLPTGIIALQTTDAETLKAIRRDNIKTSSYETMMAYFNSQSIPMASDIMIGLPGQTIDSLHRDLQFCFDWKVTANGNYTSMMPNAPMAERSYRKEHAIETDARGLISSTSSFSAAELGYMKQLFNVYHFHIRTGILKYYLYYLQIECGIQAIDFLRRWLDRVLEEDSSIPLALTVFKQLLPAGAAIHSDWDCVSWDDSADFFFKDLEAYYRELYGFSEREFGVKIDASALQTLFLAQEAVSPRPGRRYPYRVELDHDISAYMAQIKTAKSLHDVRSLRTLDSFPRGVFEVRAEEHQVESLTYLGLGHNDEWELESAIRFY